MLNPLRFYIFTFPNFENYYKGLIIRCIQKYFLGVLLVLSNLCVSQTPNWNWSSGWAGADTDLGRGVYVDSLGNTYQVGSFSSASISLPTLGTLSNSGAVGTSDIMIAKFDKFGTPLWQVKAGGSGDDIAYCVTADRDGNVYVGGSSHSSSCVFYGSTNVTLTAGSSTDIFTAKFNSSGQVLWVETASGSATDEVLSITADKDYIYVAGYFSNVLTFPSSGSLNSTGGEDMFLVKYDLDGNIIWTKKEGGTGNDRCTGITNNKTDLFISGYATNGITYNGSPTITKTSVGIGGQDITFAKIDKDGDPVWAKIEGNSSNCAANSITVLKGKVIVGGYFFGSMIYNSISLIVPGTANNMIFAEYNLDGTFNILRLTATAGDEFVQSLTSDSRYFYVSGKYANNTDFGGTSSISSSSNNMFIACYDTLFNLKFVKLSTGSSVSQVLSCSANQNGMVSTTGTYNGSSIQFAPLATQANSNLEDFYVANFNACFPISTNTIASSQTVCIGSSVANLTGSVPTGGNDSYTYLWQNSSDGITWTNAAGTNTLVNYNVPSITSTTYFKRIVYSCSEVSSSNQVTITIVPNPTVSIISSSSTLCSGSTITLTASGASSYTWTSGPSTSSYTINTAGVYTVTGSNSNGCVDSKTINISSSPIPTINAIANPTVICMGGTSTLTSSGASTYTWSSGAISSTVSINTAGIYTVTGTNASGCSSTQTVSLFVNANPTVTAVSSSTAICAGSTATLVAGGATTYTWSSGPTTSTYTTSSAGIYTVTGTDGNNCADTKTVSLVVNALPVVTAVSSSSAICSGKSATLTASGTSTYTWTSGPTNSTYTTSTAGIYTVTGTDGNFCANASTVSLVVNASPTVSVNSGTICSGNSFTILPTGASTYTYSSGTNIVSPATLTSYSITGSNVFGCISTNTAISSVDVMVCTPAEAINFDGIDDHIIIPKPISTDFTIEYWMKTTQTGSAAAQWWGGNGIVDADSPIAGSSDFGTSLTGSKLAFGIGIPDVTIKSTSNVNTGSWIHIAVTWKQTTGEMKLYVNGILESTGISNTMPRTFPTRMTVGSRQNAVGFYNGYIDELRLWTKVRTQCEINTFKNCEIPTNDVGLVSNYHFNQGYNSAPNYSVNNLFDASGSANTGTLTNMALAGPTSNWISPGSVVSGFSTPSNYTPTISTIVSNSVVCYGNSSTLSGTGASTYSWTSSVINGVAFTPTLTNTYTVIGTSTQGCTNTAIASVTVNNTPTITASNGTICAGYSYTILPTGAISYTYSGGSNIVSPIVTSVYTVTGNNALGCTSTKTVSLIVNSNPTITAVSSSSSICSGATATLTAGGASTYTWTSGPSTSSYSVTTAGIYTVTGTDLNSCTNTQTVGLIVNSNPTVTPVSSSSAICSGATATLTAGGASTYTWTSGPSTSSYSVTTAGVYTVTGTDLNLCTNTQTVSLVVNSNPTVTAVSSSSAICSGQTATLTAGGASTYTWTSGSSTSSYSVTIAGIYTVTGTDLNSCTNTQTVSLIVNSNPTVTAVSSSSAICSGQTATLTAGGASTYTWTSGPSTSSYSVNTAGVYTVTGTDLNSCTNTQTVGLIVNSNPTITAVSSSSAICSGQTATLTAGGASTYTWTSGPSTSSYSVITAGVYTVTGTDLNLCINTQTVDLIVNSNPTITAVSSSSVICADATATLSATGATSYFWVFGPATSTYIVNTAGVYTVVGTDVNSCNSSQTVTLVVNSLPNIILNSGAICIGNSFTLNPSGALSYTIMGGAGTSLIVNPTSTTTYTIEGTDINGCVNSQTTEVTVNMLPTVANAGEDIFVSTSTVALNGNTPLIGVGSWAVLSGDGTLQNSNLNNSNFYNLSQGEHVLVWQISNLNCPTSYDTLLVYRKETLFPELITPNNDGNNDYLYFNLAEYNSNLTIEVFNRWGKTVYKNSDYKNEFNGISLSGEELPEDTYFVILADTEKKIYSGYFLLKRK